MPGIGPTGSRPRRGGALHGAVFGWTFVDNPMGKTITHRGVVIGGASAVKAGLDTHWTPYIACGDVDAAAARAVAAGGVRDPRGVGLAAHAE